ncbi:MAG: SPOR domain-containing protein [bacterium]|nr:SPOR domain-containing protein [bacterium]
MEKQKIFVRSGGQAWSESQAFLATGHILGLVGLLFISLAALAAVILLREKLSIQDSVKELEFQIKLEKSQDQFTFFHTLPDRKGSGVGRAGRISSASLKVASPSCGCKRYMVQVAALRMEDEAERVIRWLKARGYSAYLSKEEAEGSASQPWYRVRIGWFSDRKEAERQLRELSEKAGFQGFIIAAGQQ